MAAPFIDSIIATPSTVVPGGSFVVTITAHDPDARVGTLTGTVRDAAGNQSQASAVVTVSDPLTYALTGVGFTIVQRAGAPNIFDCVAA